MTLGELIMNGTIKDEDRIIIRKSVSGTVSGIAAAGNWFNDNVLDYQNDEIYAISYIKGKGWMVNMDRIEVQ